MAAIDADHASQRGTRQPTHEISENDLRALIEVISAVNDHEDLMIEFDTANMVHEPVRHDRIRIAIIENIAKILGQSATSNDLQCCNAHIEPGVRHPSLGGIDWYCNSANMTGLRQFIQQGRFPGPRLPHHNDADLVANLHERPTKVLLVTARAHKGTSTDSAQRSRRGHLEVFPHHHGRLLLNRLHRLSSGWAKYELFISF